LCVVRVKLYFVYLVFFFFFFFFSEGERKVELQLDNFKERFGRQAFRDNKQVAGDSRPERESHNDFKHV
jgi:hypothetical protein